MPLRLLAIAVIALYLGGALPRWLTGGGLAWTVWLSAALIVLAGPRLMRGAARRALVRLRGARSA